MEKTTITTFGGCDIIVLADDKEAFGIEALHWSHEKVNGLYEGSLVLNYRPNPVAGPHDLTIRLSNEYGIVTTNMVYGVRLLDKEAGGEINWIDAELNTAYKITLEDFTGWRDCQ